MTTVIACRPLLAIIADTNVSHGEVNFKNRRKIRRAGKYLLGVAGDFSHALRYASDFVEKARGMDGRTVPTLDAMDGVFELLVLSEHGMWLYGDDGTPIEVEEEWYAIGTGAVAAGASLMTQERTCTAYDLQMALEIACENDSGSRLPGVTLALKGKK